MPDFTVDQCYEKGGYQIYFGLRNCTVSIAFPLDVQSPEHAKICFINKHYVTTM